jgi:hypothetical protein
MNIDVSPANFCSGTFPRTAHLLFYLVTGKETACYFSSLWIEFDGGVGRAFRSALSIGLGQGRVPGGGSMKWKTLGQIAKWTAFAVVPGATGYAAYRYVVRPWLDKRAARNKAESPPLDDPARVEESAAMSETVEAENRKT